MSNRKVKVIKIGPDPSIGLNLQYIYTGDLLSVSFADFINHVGSSFGFDGPCVRVTIEIIDK